ncbi:O-acetyl-ADP-ribose deacetylase [Companilactobacillus allii]|uniref:O-acetyl-ADP-ribose deacetylase n=1 Tax=Companilactobacillus allii TaxID=1847728 RepID=A0A1P8Q3N4_9LACO|nr:O-acetyl-ADP-ribose deacetylase [Companilactobacillus allii]APX72433.1 O-acetyl-ADP-ribose deacetylase [Companilactobacillus allii]USQ69528.1 O-acetyl-ADP-ribose deacetylase [Companilactobacillus allii]
MSEYLSEGSSIKAKVCDITMIKCDAIVNAANKTLLGGGGVDGAIHTAAGPKLLEECIALNGCETGEAKLTRGYNLPARYIIHTVGPIYSGSDKDPVMLANCYKNSLNVAKQNNLHSITFAAISTGIYAYPIDDAAKIALNTIKDWIVANKNYKVEVLMSCFDGKIKGSYDKYLAFL